jgi:hypothetical protein
MATQAQYDAAEVAAGVVATAAIKEVVAKVPEPFRAIVEQQITENWSTIAGYIKDMSKASVDAAVKAAPV